MFLLKAGSSEHTASCHSSSQASVAQGNSTKPAMMRSSGVERRAAQNPLLCCCFFPSIKSKRRSEMGWGRGLREESLFIFPSIWLALELHEQCGFGVSGRGSSAPHPPAFVLNWGETSIYCGKLGSWSGGVVAAAFVFGFTQDDPHLRPL